MRILVTVDTFYPLKDGIQNITQLHLEQFVKNKHKVTVVTTNPYGLKNYEEYNGIEIYRVCLFTKFGIHYGEKKAYLNLVKKLSQTNDILINVCLQSATTDILLPYLKNLNLPKILYLHGKFDFDFNLFRKNKSMKNLIANIYFNFRWGIYYYFVKNTLNNYNRFVNIFENDSATVYLNKLKKQVEIIHNFYDPKLLNNDFIEKQNIIVCVSNFSKLKNQEEVIDVFHDAHLENYKLILIGERKNKYSEFLEKKCENLYGLKQKNIVFKYGLEKTEIFNYLKLSKIFIFCSKTEKFPVVLIESLINNTPFISKNIGLIRYLPGGIVVNNKKDMIWWIKEFVLDDILRNSYANLGYTHVKKYFNFEIENKKFEKIMEETINLYEK